MYMYSTTIVCIECSEVEGQLLMQNQRFFSSAQAATKVFSKILDDKSHIQRSGACNIGK
jgi:hypothetical protein